MAYEVTATRRRPQHFEDLAGQEFVAETLKNTIKSKSIAHAYLFTGPRGCGKTSTARILAKALNCQCQDGPTEEPCGQCESCKAITNSSSLDVIEIDGASNTSVNDVRQIKDEVMFPPANARYKIYIIDEVHMLSTPAFNALLKTIEEPPAHVIFIFATTEIQKVPATIKSRCQQFNFRLVSAEKVKSLLSDACKEMNIQAEDEALYWIAKESGGSVRDSYTLFDQIAAFSGSHITYEKIRDKLGLLGIDKLNVLFESACLGHSENTIDLLDQLLQSGISIEQIISNSTEYLRSLLLIQNGITKESLLGNSAERYSKTVLQTWNTIQTERAVSIFLELYRNIRYSISARYELELAFSRLCWLKDYVSPSEVKAAIDKAHALLETAPIAPAVTQAAPTISQVAPAMAQPVSSPAQTKTTSTVEQTAPVQENPPQNIPMGMPRFSIFEKKRPENPPQEQTPVTPEGEANPFYNGGALPPENTAASTINSSTEEYSYAPEGEYPESEFDYQSDDYSESFDLPDASEEPPLSDEDKLELQKSQAEALENQISENNPELTDSDSLHHSEEKITAPDGYVTTLGKLYGAVLAELSINNAMLGSTLMTTGPWKLFGSTIATTIKNDYQKKFLDQNSQTLNELLSKLAHTNINFSVKLIEEKKQEEPQELPLQVKILCNVFKGNVFGAK